MEIWIRRVQLQGQRDSPKGLQSDALIRTRWKSQNSQKSMRLHGISPNKCEEGAHRNIRKCQYLAATIPKQKFMKRFNKP